MDLDISNATIGFDYSGKKDLMDAINVGVIGTVIDDLNALGTNLDKVVKEGWVGKSADIFMENVEYDLRKIVEALNATKEVINNELENICERLGELDESVIQKRGGN